ncbi:MAG: hypothetical protein BWY32_00574 [bacterium ADurb.Bin243]|nr:MAG: hypothetical protein BWY32_00574 [bacterium ADurb.Bin243]
MSNYVVDTNILAAANGKATHLSESDFMKCCQFLKTFFEKKQNHISIDSIGLIFREYLNNASLAGRPGIGDSFLKWLFSNRANTSICESVCINPVSDSEYDFREFPNDIDLVGFDKSDKKFVAVAIASKKSPEICNACDSDWNDYAEALKKHGVKILNII